MPIVDASVGTETANSYVLVADADAYFEASFGRDLWAPATAEQKQALVVYASRTLDAYMTWEGVQTSSTQSMEWPREGAYNRTGTEYDSDIIPMPVKFATYELAYYILANGGLSFEEQTLDEVKVGSVGVKFSNASVDAGIPKFVEALINHIGTTVLAGKGAAYTAELVRS